MQKLEALNRNEENPLMRLQGENPINYTVISEFINTKKNTVNVNKYLEVNFTYTGEATMLIQSTCGDVMRVSMG